MTFPIPDFSEAARPFLKWAGGKTTLLHEMLPHFPPVFNTYWEPFLGSGAVFFGLRPYVTEANLSDAVPDLMVAWQQLQKDWKAVADTFDELWQRHEQDDQFYFHMRGQEISEPVMRAARMIYLNWSCYNGLYRVNKAGRMNVSKGKASYMAVVLRPTRERLAAAGEALQGNIRLSCIPFDAIRPDYGDLVYVDPPDVGGYDQYTPERFGEEQHRLLAECCHSWIDTGAYVVVSNAYHPLVRELYPLRRWDRHIVKARGNIGGKNSKRVEREEYLMISKQQPDPMRF